MIRYAVMAKTDSGEWMSIFEDSRTFARKVTAERHKRLFSWGRPYETRIDEVEVMTMEEKLQIATEALDEIHLIQSVGQTAQRIATAALMKIKSGDMTSKQPQPGERA